MNLTWTPRAAPLPRGGRGLAAASLPPDIRDKVLRHQRLERDDYVRWHLVLADRGWGAPTWPVEHGGTGWNALQRLIFEVECFKAGAPRLLPFGLSMIGPVLMKYGSAAQQAELLPRIIRVQDWWCQGYSEPGSGSTWPRCRPAPSATAASTWSTARRPGPRWRNTPTACSAWSAPITARAPSAAFPCCCWTCERPASACVRSDAGRWLRRQRSLAGKRARAGRQPGGEENQGWTYAKYLLGHERTGIAGLGHCHRELGILAHGVAGDFTGPSAAGRQPHARPHFAHRGRHHGAGDAAAARGRGDGGAPGAEASVLKIRGSEIQQDLAMLQMEVAGLTAGPTTRTGCWRARTGTGRGRRWRLPPARLRRHAQDLDLRRHHGSAEGHHRAPRAGAVTSGCWSPDARQRQPVDGSPAPLLPQGKPRMDFIYTEEQRMLADSLRRLVAQDWTQARRRKRQAAGTLDAGAWDALAGLGVLGLNIAENCGGRRAASQPAAGAS